MPKYRLQNLKVMRTNQAPTSRFQGRVLENHDSYRRQRCKGRRLSLSAVMGGCATENISPKSNCRHLHRGGALFPRMANRALVHQSQGVRHCAESCMALGR
jgi:hypothetical protein